MLSRFRPMLQNKYFIKNLSLLIGIILLLFLACTFYSNHNSRKILENELLSADKNYIEIVGNSVDSVLSDMRFIIATLDIDSTVDTFLYSAKPATILPDIYIRLQEKLNGYVNSYSCIHSIYLYSERSNMVISQQGDFTIPSFTDFGWRDAFVDNPDSITTMCRSYNNAYPDFLTLVKQIKIGEENAAIVLNMTLKDIAILSETKQRNSDIYIINDASQVIYHKNQRFLFEPLDISDRLTGFSPLLTEDSYIATDEKGITYAYTQLHDPKYDFSYVLVTNFSNYSDMLFGRQTMLFTIFMGLFLVVFILFMVMGLRFFKPIDMLTKLLSESEESLLTAEYPSREISDLAEKIISYAQTNRQLADELATSLQKLTQSQILALQAQVNPHFLFNTLSIIHIKECQELGYFHPLPEITLKLGQILRYAIESTNMVSLQTELDFIKKYIELLKFHESNDIDIVYDIDDALLDVKVPKLFIQPLIENAFFHAFPEDYHKDNRLIISFRGEGAHFIATLTDNGIGMPPEKRQELLNCLEEDLLPSTSIGVRNVISRMKLIYGEKLELDIDSSEHHGTCFKLVFPKN